MIDRWPRLNNGISMVQELHFMGNILRSPLSSRPIPPIKNVVWTGENTQRHPGDHSTPSLPCNAFLFWVISAHIPVKGRLGWGDEC